MDLPEAHRLHEMGWEWFKLLAQQRMQLVSFWLVSMSFLSTGAIVAYTGEHFSASILVLCAIVASSAIFYLFDVRTQELIKRGEDLMIKAESFMHVLGGDSEIRLATGLHDSKSVPYRRLFPALYLGACALALVGLLAAATEL